MVFLALWVVGGLLALAGALSLAELAATFPESGGYYAYLRESWGRGVAFLFGWTQLVLLRASAIGGIALTCGQYTLRMLGVDPSAHPLSSELTAAAAIVIASSANIVGARIGAVIVNASTSAKFVALIALAGLALALGGAHGASTANFASTTPVTASSFGLALVSVLWAYDGFGDVSFAGGEVIRPHHTLPRAIIGGTVAVVVDPAPLLRAKAEREALEAAIRTVAPGNALVFLEQGDAGNKRSASLSALEAAVLKAGGEARAFKAPRASELAGWIVARATERGMQLQPAAAKELARRVGGFVSEGDVDRQRMGALAVGELDKLALYRPFDPVSEEDVRALVAEVVPDSTWAFLDAVAERRVAMAAPALDRLLETTPEPVITVQLHRRLRELLIAADLVRQHARPADIVKAIGGHPFRAQKLADQARAWTVPELEDALEGVMDLDAMVKNAPDSGSTERQRRLAFALWIESRVAPKRPSAAGRP